jgi:hypothetical protein
LPLSRFFVASVNGRMNAFALANVLPAAVSEIRWLVRSYLFVRVSLPGGEGGRC